MDLVPGLQLDWVHYVWVFLLRYRSVDRYGFGSQWRGELARGGSGLGGGGGGAIISRAEVMTLDIWHWGLAGGVVLSVILGSSGTDGVVGFGVGLGLGQSTPLPFLDEGTVSTLSIFSLRVFIFEFRALMAPVVVVYWSLMVLHILPTVFNGP